MSRCVLLVVDVQTALIAEHPYNEQQVIENMKELISTARDHEKEVIYVRHDDGIGEDLEYGTDGWQIYADIAPISTDEIIDKRCNSAFYKTNLRQYLESKQIDTIILVGLQTEYCIDATCKSAFDFGYQVIIPEESNTTFDNEFLTGKRLYEFYNYKIWNQRFAKVIPVKEAIQILSDSLPS